MNKLRANIDQWLEGLDKNWEAIPIKRQHQVILCFFAAYVLLNAVVILNVCRDTLYARNNVAIENIESPASAGKESPASLKPIKKK